MFGVPSAVAAAPQRAPKPSDTVRDSALWESLPRRISCNSIRYERGKFLGKGGFARVYEMTDLSSNITYACKIVKKASLVQERIKLKLISEINIHRSLEHPHIVRFHHWFEDREHIYILLELCTNKTVMRMLKKRGRLSEPEVRYMLAQLSRALVYLKEQRVIHRDLKLGNLMLDSALNVKVGDFGLAARLDDDTERRKTICGTPNYIAPEILKGDHRHSFEVDVWSLGVISYTLLVGKAPFESDDIKTTYKKIQANAYSFPDTPAISAAAESLIRAMLDPVPEMRPTMESLLSHEFFQPGIPHYLPLLALRSTPVPNAPGAQSASAHPPLLAVAPDHAPMVLSSALTETENSSERSPLTERLSESASNRQHQHRHHQAAKKPTSRVASVLAIPTTSSSPASSSLAAAVALSSTMASSTPSKRAPALAASRKFTHPPSPPPTPTRYPLAVAAASTPPVPSSEILEALPSAAYTLDSTVTSTTSSVTLSNVNEMEVCASVATASSASTSASCSEATSLSTSASASAATATASMDICSDGPIMSSERVYVVKWQDFSTHYGLGYELSNGTIGALFNDRSHMTFEPARSLISYRDLAWRWTGDVAATTALSAAAAAVAAAATGSTRTTGSSERSPAEQAARSSLAKKLRVLEYFAMYFTNHPLHEAAAIAASAKPVTPAGRSQNVAASDGRKPELEEEEGVVDDDDADRALAFGCVAAWLRTKHGVLFRLSSGATQANFADHVKIILWPDATSATIIDRRGRHADMSVQQMIAMPQHAGDLANRLRYLDDFAQRYMASKLSPVASASASAAGSTRLGSSSSTTSSHR